MVVLENNTLIKKDSHKKSSQQRQKELLVFLIVSVNPSILCLSLHQYAAELKPMEWNIIFFFTSSISMNDFKLVRFDDKYLFIVLQITYFTGLPQR